ncbi:hypothetical protein SUSAZ_02800 [Sulfolobus acidocaldarius SUSAZ]|nr:hypothetical protein SUSAZ_02800 [Sulfolobus acidocaldarius SUSAZ]
MKISEISISVFCHETENKDRILSSISSFFNIQSNDFVSRVVQGYYGNRIIVTEIKIKGKLAIEAFNKLINALDKADLVILISTLNTRLDGTKLHIRVDKQRLIYDNKIYLKEGDDVIKIIISFKERYENISEELRNFASRAMRS